MNYPVWYLPAIGGGSPIALITVAHVFVAHFAVGGLFLALTESMLHGECQSKLRLSVLLVSLLVLLGASREAACSPLAVSGILDKPGTKQVLTSYHLTGGFFGRRAAPATGGELSRDMDRLLFEQNCTLCHTAELVKKRTASWSRNRIRTALDQLNQLHPAMPDYLGTPQEKDRLADYIYLLNNAKPESVPER